MIPILLLLAVLVFILVGFVALLVRRDLTPQLALRMIRRKFSAEPIPPPSRDDAPYERKIGHKARHQPVVLNLPTSDGTGQACHPDVLFLPKGFGPCNWRYWMVCTPYAYSYEANENPELFASHDGVFWEIPPGVKNPLVPSLPPGQGHNSDPDMLFHDGKLWLYFRQTTRFTCPPENRILLTTSYNGASWSTPRQVLFENRGTQLLCPSVTCGAKGFRMWTIEWISNRFCLRQRRSQDGLTWSEPSLCTVEGLHQNRELWHLDVLEETDRLSSIFVTGINRRQHRIHYGYSLDGGTKWTLGPFLLEQAHAFEAGFQYRASLRRMPGPAALYQLWYSSCNTNLMFSIALVYLERIENSLVPAAPRPRGEYALRSAGGDNSEQVLIE